MVKEEGFKMPKKEKPSKSGTAYHRAIVSATINRDANLTKEEFFKKLKIDDMSKDELKVVLGICFNAIVEISRIHININSRLKDVCKFIQIPLTEEQREEIKKNTEEALKGRHTKKKMEAKMEGLKNGN